MKRFASNLLLALVSTLVILIIAELVLRTQWDPSRTLAPLVHTRTTTGEYDADIVTNRAGFRDDDHELPSVGRITARVAVIGDSFVFGSGALPGDLVTSRMESLLSKEPEIVDVYNFGVPGTGPFNALYLWRHHVRAVHPDVVVVALYAGNDASDALRESRPSTPRSVVLARAKALLRGRLALWRHNTHAHVDTFHVAGNPPAFGWNAFGLENPAGRDALLAAARTRGVPEDSVRARLAAIPDSLVEDARAFRSNPFNLAEAVLDPDGLRHNLLLDTPKMEEGWRALESALGELNEEATKQNAKLVLASIPAAVQVDSTYWWLKNLGVRLDRRVIKQPEFQHRLAAFASREDIPLVDLLPVMRAHPQSRLYYEQDGHWTQLGHALAAEAISERIREWLPPAKDGKRQ